MSSIPTIYGAIRAFARGKTIGLPFGACGVHRWPTDPIGYTYVTFSGVNAGSEIRIYLPDATEATGVENSAADPVLAWPVYAHGSSNNEVRIVIVHLDYKIKEFTYSAAVGTQSIPVQQEPDSWYSNP